VPPDPEPFDSPLFSLLRGFSRIYVRGYHDVVALNACPIPRRGPVIIAPNHTSALDPLVVQAVVRRPIVWMMASEYMDIPMTRWFWRATRIIPVARDGRDSVGARSAIRVLRAGGALGVFPEGRIETARELLPLHTGIFHMAIRAHAPIFPVWLDGSQRNQGMVECFTRRNRTTIIFGNPRLKSPDHLNSQISDEFKALQNKTEAYLKQGFMTDLSNVL
jgi:1-acyl-sn-glycerol-3-phosphate acyltransferase